MTVPDVLTKKGKSGNFEAPKKIYAQGKGRLSKEIAEGSTTVSDSGVLSVFNDLTKILKRHLSNGEIVRFGDFGSFQVAITNEGVEKWLLL
jgi:nucleoid DNA-binding protein